jgi:Domain of unknown function (DUF4157)
MRDRVRIRRRLSSYTPSASLRSGDASRSALSTLLSRKKTESAFWFPSLHQGHDLSRVVISPQQVQRSAQLTVSQPNDACELEADRVADQVMRMPDSVQAVQPGQPQINRQCACEQEEEITRKVGSDESVVENDGAIAQVNRAVSSGGQPLDQPTRHFMESRFGHDFSQVKIHAHSQAAESAQTINARAYTLGQDVVFNTGEYAPNTESGKHLLAHELTHVVQQSGSVQRQVMREESAELAIASPTDTLVPLDGEITPASADVDTAGLDVDVASLFPEAAESEGGELASMKGINKAIANLAAALKASCSPDRSLTWADFKGSPSGSFSAETAYKLQIQAIDGISIISATFNPQASWVKPMFGKPTDAKATGCEKTVNSCQGWFAKNTNGTWGPLTKNTSSCSASIPYNSSVTAQQSSDCSSQIGAECSRVAQIESDRLLKHEQTHFDIGCAIARKGTAAILSAAPGTHQQILNAVKKASNEQNTKYDNATSHGCNASSQASWEADVKAGLPSVKIP